MHNRPDRLVKVVTLTCPQCRRQHRLEQANLLPGGKFRCPCGWSMRVVGHQRPDADRPRPLA